ncbi:TPA: hypothetical protein N6538_004562 [Escherichia coli]|nr:hypothetical protein [Escherichia coli]HCO0049387.1 hypothetical protein [Escherichia coli]
MVQLVDLARCVSL